MMKKKILLVDDMEEIHEVIKGLLEDDYEITSALNGKEALKKLLTEHFDLVILDNHMPIYTGLEVLEEIRRLQIKAPTVYLHTSDSGVLGKHKPSYKKLDEQMFVDLAKLLEE